MSNAAEPSVTLAPVNVNISPKDVERFWRKVDKEGSVPEHAKHLGPCWIWKSAVSNEYPGFWLQGKYRVGTRVAWMIKHGEIPDGYQVLHHCDTPLCVNNEGHLFLGTHRDNMDDRDRKGRQAKGQTSGAFTHPEKILKGEDNPAAKLTPEDVLEIRRLYLEEGLYYKQIADRYGVTLQIVAGIVKGESWKHLSLPPIETVPIWKQIPCPTCSAKAYEKCSIVSTGLSCRSHRARELAVVTVMAAVGDLTNLRRATHQRRNQPASLSGED